jgi:hypothetical protein
MARLWPSRFATAWHAPLSPTPAEEQLGLRVWDSGFRTVERPLVPRAMANRPHVFGLLQLADMKANVHRALGGGLDKVSQGYTLTLQTVVSAGGADPPTIPFPSVFWALSF